MKTTLIGKANQGEKKKSSRSPVILEWTNRFVVSTRNRREVQFYEQISSEKESEMWVAGL